MEIADVMMGRIITMVSRGIREAAIDFPENTSEFFVGWLKSFFLFFMDC